MKVIQVSHLKTNNKENINVDRPFLTESDTACLKYKTSDKC